MSSNRPDKQPIVEQTFGEKLETWYDRNGMWINVLVIVVLVGIVGYKGYQWITDRNVARANTAYATALTHYQNGVMSPDKDEKQDELQGAITAAQQVVADYSDEFVGRQAQLMIGNAQYAIATANSGQDVEQLENAKASFEKYLEMAASDAERAAGHIAIGNVLENLAFIRDDKPTLEQAVEAYNKAAELAEGTALGGQAKLSAALAKSGMTDPAAEQEAKQLYTEVAENRPIQLVSEEALENVQEIPTTMGQPVTAEQVRELKNMTAWSQQQQAKDALAHLK